MVASPDVLGSVDWIVVEFPGSKFNGEIAPAIQDLVDKGLVRILDLLIIKKDDDGEFEVFEMGDLDDSEIGELRRDEAELAMVLSEQDVTDLAVTIEPGSSAAVLVWENVWAAPVGAAIRHAGGQLVASGRIPTRPSSPSSRPTSNPSRQTRSRKETDMPMARRRMRRTAAVVGGAAVVAHGVNRRGDRREDRRDDRRDRRGRD